MSLKKHLQLINSWTDQEKLGLISVISWMIQFRTDVKKGQYLSDKDLTVLREALSHKLGAEKELREFVTQQETDTMKLGAALVIQGLQGIMDLAEGCPSADFEWKAEAWLRNHPAAAVSKAS